jgi:hypothetical protein
LVLVACNWLVGPVCTLSIEPALRVSFVDSMTARPIVTESKAVVVDGTYADTAIADRSPDATIAILAMERPGIYRVEAIADGYRTWVKDGVRVREGECHVETVEIEALMQPLEGG